MFLYFLNKKDFRFKIGFTLVEIMIVVAIVIMLAVMAIPNLLRSRTTALEGMAVASLRAINNACQLYLNNKESYPSGLGDLIPPNSNPPYIDTELASGTKKNYNFSYSLTDNGFTVNANPINRVGNPRFFYVDQSGVVHFNENGLAGAGDQIFS